MSNTQLGTCVLEVALCLSQQLLDDSKADGSSYSVGESVMARRLDGEFGEGTVLDALHSFDKLAKELSETALAMAASAEP